MEYSSISDIEKYILEFFTGDIVCTRASMKYITIIDNDYITREGEMKKLTKPQNKRLYIPVYKDNMRNMNNVD